MTPVWTLLPAGRSARQHGFMRLRDELAASVKARVQRAVAIGDLSPVLEPAALADAERLAALLHDGDVPAMHLLGWFHWFRHQARPGGEDLAAALAMFSLPHRSCR